jgi:hypothetical protein
MKDKWNQDFFWILDHTNTWFQKKRLLVLDDDGSSVYSFISGVTENVESDIETLPPELIE